MTFAASRWHRKHLDLARAIARTMPKVEPFSLWQRLTHSCWCQRKTTFHPCRGSTAPQLSFTSPCHILRSLTSTRRPQSEEAQPKPQDWALAAIRHRSAWWFPANHCLQGKHCGRMCCAHWGKGEPCKQSTQGTNLFRQWRRGWQPAGFDWGFCPSPWKAGREDFFYEGHQQLCEPQGSQHGLRLLSGAKLHGWYCESLCPDQLPQSQHSSFVGCMESEESLHRRGILSSHALCWRQLSRRHAWLLGFARRPLQHRWEAWHHRHCRGDTKCWHGKNSKLSPLWRSPSLRPLCR